MICSLNEKIRELRVSKKLSQVEFSRLLGVTKQCVSNWENDNVLPSVEMLSYIAELFGVSVDYLLGRDGKISIDVSMLTDEQRGHIALLVDDFAKLNLAQGNK